MANPSNRVNVELRLKNFMTKGLRKASKSLNQFSVGAQRAGLAMGAGAAVMGVGLGKTVMMAAELDSNMRKVQARVSGIGSEDIQNLTGLAKELGRTTSFTTTEVSDLMAKLAQAGSTAPEIEAMTKPMLAFSRATGVSTEQAAEFAMTAAASFGVAKDSAEDMSHVMDVLTFASNNSFQGVEDLGEALKQAAPIAASTGQSMEDVVSTLALLANFGIKGSNAGRQMKKIMTDMGGNGRKMADDLGVNVKKIDGSMKSIPDLLGDFAEKTKDMGDVEAMAVFNKAFGRIGLNAAMLGGKGAEGIRKMAEEMRSLDGLSQATADTMDGGIAGTLKRLTSALQGIALSIGESLIPVVDWLSARLTEVANLVTPFIEKLSWLGPVIAGVFMALAGGSAILLTLAGIATIAAAGFSAVASVVAFVGGLITSAMAAPLGITAAIIAGMIISAGAFLAVIVDWGAVFEAIMKPLRAFFGAFSEGWEGIKLAIEAGDLSLAFKIVMKTLQLAFTQALDSMFSNWRGWLVSVVNGLSAVALQINDIWSEMVKGISKAIIWVMEKIKLVSSQTADTMRDNVDEDSKNAKKAMQDNITSAADTINSFASPTESVKDELEELTAYANLAAVWKHARDEAAKEADRVKQEPKKEKSSLEKAFDMAKEAANSAAYWAQTNLETVRVGVAKTSGSTGAFSAAGLASQLSKDSLDIQKDQLRAVTYTNKILLKQKKKPNQWTM